MSHAWIGTPIAVNWVSERFVEVRTLLWRIYKKLERKEDGGFLDRVSKEMNPMTVGGIRNDEEKKKTLMKKNSLI